MATRWWNKDTPFEVPDKHSRGGNLGRALLPGGVSVIQQKTIQFWRTWTDEHGYPPTIREASKALGLSSTNAVDCQLRILIRKGVMRDDGLRGAGSTVHRARAAQLTELGRSLTTGEDASAFDMARPLYIQTSHGFVGSVTQERKCACGQSHFTNAERCADCLRAGKVVT